MTPLKTQEELKDEADESERLKLEEERFSKVSKVFPIYS